MFHSRHIFSQSLISLVFSCVLISGAVFFTSAQAQELGIPSPDLIGNIGEGSEPTPQRTTPEEAGDTVEGGDSLSLLKVENTLSQESPERGSGEELATICVEGITTQVSLSLLGEHVLAGASVGECPVSSKNTSLSNSNDDGDHKGKIRVCKIITNPDGGVVRTGGNVPLGNFTVTLANSIPELGSQTETLATDISAYSGYAILPFHINSYGSFGENLSQPFRKEFSWTTQGWTPNTDLLKNDGVKDAYCQNIDGLTLGSYYYSQELLSPSANWITPKYNDQNTVKVESLENFYLYSNELFTPEIGDDSTRNENADGHIVLTKDRPNRTLVIVNRFKNDIPVPPECVIEGYKYDADGHPLSGWTIGVSNAFMCSDKEASGESMRITRETDQHGHYCFEKIENGQYTVFEQMKDGWKAVKITVNGTDRQATMNDFFDASVEVGVESIKTIKVNFYNTEIPKPLCADGKDNDNDEKIDYPADTGCENGADNDENARPIITVLGGNPLTVTQGTPFVDPGATAHDEENGVISPVVTTGGVNTAVSGTYTLTYNAKDSKNLYAVPKTRTVYVVPQAETKAKIVATKIVCEDEKDLPNWGNGGPNITSSTVSTFLETHPNCRPASDWNFQWGGKTVTDPGNSFIGNATSGWTTFGPTDAQGVAMVNIPVTSQTGKIWVRESLKSGYIPFAHPAEGNPVSAELYCHTDVLNYDNYDNVAEPKAGSTYYCVAWNVLKEKLPQCSDGLDNDSDGKIDYPADLGCDSADDNNENAKPVITVGAPNPYSILLGSTFVDPTTTTATDIEDGNLTSQITRVSTVNSAVLGSYTVTYTVSDSKGLAADPKTRTVNVVSVCTDGIDNDGDGKIDFGTGPSNDSGCDSVTDNNENNPPVITLLGANPMTITVGTLFVDPGATATDPEDGVISPIVRIGGVNENVVGTYTLSYFASDSEGLHSETVNRIVHVVPVITQCSDGIDNDGDEAIDYPTDLGCDGTNDNDENAKPVITVVLPNPTVVSISTLFVDPGATATDEEDGVIAPVHATGTVDTNVLGSYTITYTVSDSDGLAADPETRTVNVTSQCSDGIDNDQDGMIDFGGSETSDSGCQNGEDNNENNPPVITLIGGNPLEIIQGNAFTDPGATATDQEDGTLTSSVSGSVNTGAVGSYTLTYTATDSGGLTAQVTRTVNVISSGCTSNCGGGGGTPPQCADGTDNDADGKADYPADPGCDSSLDNDERGLPVITLLGGNPLSVPVGGTYSDPGATAKDPEDGDITSKIVVSGDSVNVGQVGTYIIRYNVKDIDNNAAPEVTRTVNVTSGGGGGGGPIGLSIFNERLTMVDGSTAKITWNTNQLSDSRVVYGPQSRNPLVSGPNYGYQSTTATNTALTSNHEMIITNLPVGTLTYFRPISKDNVNQVVGIELSSALVAGECTYLEKHLRLGYQNDPFEVTKLQNFLKEFEGFTNLKVSGFFDLETDKAVRTFQDRYANEVLTPWGLPQNTGYVYYTTKKKINEIYCKKAFPLDSAQLEEIQGFLGLMQKVAVNVVTPEGSSDLSSGPSITVEPSPTLGASNGGNSNDQTLARNSPPVVTLVPEVGSGVSTDEPSTEESVTVKNGKITPSKLLATLPISFGKYKNKTATSGDNTVQEGNGGTSTIMSMALIGNVASAFAGKLGLSTGSLVAWFVLFLLVIIFGILSVRKRNRIEVTRIK